MAANQKTGGKTGQLPRNRQNSQKKFWAFCNFGRAFSKRGPGVAPPPQGRRPVARILSARRGVAHSLHGRKGHEKPGFLTRARWNGENWGAVDCVRARIMRAGNTKNRVILTARTEMRGSGLAKGTAAVIVSPLPCPRGGPPISAAVVAPVRACGRPSRVG